MYLFPNEVQFHFTKLLRSSFYTDHVRFYTVRSLIADHFRSTILLLVCVVCATDMWWTMTSPTTLRTMSTELAGQAEQGTPLNLSLMTYVLLLVFVGAGGREKHWRSSLERTGNGQESSATYWPRLNRSELSYVILTDILHVDKNAVYMYTTVLCLPCILLLVQCRP